jgi:iron complex outermembrane receptor protein
MISKKLLSGAALTALSLSMGAGVAHAQSTASQIQDEETIVVSGVRRDADGVLAESAPKARTTITDEYIQTQTAGQTILNTINLVPGVNFTNNDGYGNSGGNLRMRGFDGNRISLTFDGAPLNDTGNYAVYSNQQLDSELISRASVNMGTTDVDSPTASATGGTVNYTTRLPSEESGIVLQPSVGTDNFYRLFSMVDSGEFGPWGTRAFGSFSYTNYDQFVGPGELEKLQANARIYQPLNGSDFVSLAVHYNRNRNNFYSQGTLADWAANDEYANLDTCVRDAPTAGVADLDGSGSSSNPLDPASCTNYYNLRINPSNTANIRGQSRFALGENFTLTVDPTIQYTLANGGGTTVVSETDNRLRAGVSGVANSASINANCVVFDGTQAGVDLNGDCDTRDSVRLYSPSNTNTLRYSLTTSLIWDVNETNRVIFGYTYDTGRHRQTGEYGLLDAQGDPQSVWGGKDGDGDDPILTLAGDVFQKRDRLSIASLSQPSVRYIGDFLNDTLTVDIGVRAPFFSRELDQRCWSTSGGTGDPVCPSGTFLPTGVAPFQAEIEYEDVLPSVGVTFRPAEGHQVYVSYAEGLSAPRTDDLYNGLSATQLDIVQPETTQSYDVGYRYNGDNVMFSAGVWYSQFQNRIVRVFDQDQGINIARNIGDVEMQGAELQLGYQATDALSAFFSLAYTDSEVQDDLPAIFTTPNPDEPYLVATGGKQLVDTPDWTSALRVEYDAGPFVFGAQARYTGERWVTDVNDLSTDAFTTLDLDARWNIRDNISLQLNVLNVLDEEYFGSINTQVCSVNPAGTPQDSDGLDYDCESGTIGTPRYNRGAPRTFMMTLRTEF